MINRARGERARRQNDGRGANRGRGRTAHERHDLAEEWLRGGETEVVEAKGGGGVKGGSRGQFSLEHRLGHA